MANDKIVIKGAREHNLKNIDLTLPREKFIVMTGLSGSGKSSLAFDTIYADGQRRYVESLSSYARMFLGRMDKPDVDEITGLSPAISIDQKTTSHNPRSTVGTVTEIYDYLRLMYARIGVPHCPVCGRVISQQTVDEMVDEVLKLPERTRFQVLAPVVRGRKGTQAKELDAARRENDMDEELQNMIGEELDRRGLGIHCATVLTQVAVNPEDPAFQHPTKPIGAFMTEEEAKKLAAEKGIDVAEDAGRGWRQVVASPKPVEIVEIETVRALMNAKHAVIAAGGGGIPVVWEDKYHLKGVPAVIDKDLASECMAEQLDADMLIILTAVEKVAINFGKPDQKGLDTLTPDEARKYIDEKQFAPGSMLPKVQAAMSFAESKPGRVALITLLEKAAEGIEGKTGTRVQM